MSLMNDALLDLQKRDQINPNALDVELSAQDHSTTTNDKSKHTRAILLSGVIVGCCLFVALPRNTSTEKYHEHALADGKSANNSGSALHQKLDDSASLTNIAKTLENAAPAFTLPEFESAPVAAELPSNTDEEGSKVRGWLTQADAALAATRLTRPSGNNALQLYQQVLRDEPDNALALEGIARVQEKYAAVLAWTLESGNVERAAVLIARAREIEALRAGLNIAKYQNLLVEMQAQKSQTLAEYTSDGAGHLVPERASQTAVPALVVTPQAQQTLEMGSRGVSNASEPAFTQTLKTRDAIFVQRATKLVAQQRAGEAVSILLPFVQQQPNAYLSILKLVEIFVQQNSADGLSALSLDLGAQHNASAYVTAQRHVLNGQLNDAILLLENATPAVELHQAQVGLLAALYQKTQQLDDAWVTYQLLTRRYPKEVTYWLGAGVVADALKKPREAYQSFASVIALGGVSPQVTTYINKRMLVLRSQIPVEVSQW